MILDYPIKRNKDLKKSDFGFSTEKNIFQLVYGTVCGQPEPLR